MSYDSNLLNTSIALIQKHGKACTVILAVNSGSVHNPTITESEVDAHAVSRSYRVDEIDGTIIKRKDKMFLIVTETDISDAVKLTENSTTFTIENIDVFEYKDSIIAYRAQCRGI